MPIPVLKKPVDDNMLTMLSTKQSGETINSWYQAQTIKVQSIEEIESIIASLNQGRLQQFVQLRTTIMDQDPELAAICTSRIDRVISSYWKVEENTTGPYDGQAAQLCFDVLRGLPNLYQALRAIADGVVLGFSANELTWGWDETAGAFMVTDIEYINGRRFIYDPTNKWRLNLYDYGSKAGKNGYGELLISNKWLVHQSSEQVGDPCLGGVMRTLSRYFMYRQWINRFWLHYDECFGQPFFDANVDPNTTRAEMEKLQVAMEAFSYDHTIVTKGATKVNVTSPSSSASVDGFERHWNMTTAVCNRYVLGSSDLNQAGAVGSRAAVETREGAVADPKRDHDMLGIASTLQEQLFKPVLRFNSHLFGGTMPGVPTFKFMYSGEEKPKEQVPSPSQVPVQVQGTPPNGSAQLARDYSGRVVYLAGDEGTGNALQIKATEAAAAFKRTGTFNEELFKSLLEDLRKQGASDETIASVKSELQKITLDAIENGKSPARVAREILDNSVISAAGVGESQSLYLEQAAQINTDLAYSGAKWDQAVQLKEDTGKTLYWEYHTMGDGNVRDTHRALKGAVFEVGNPDTDELLPPLDFNCRCYATYSTMMPEGKTLYTTALPEFKDARNPNFSW